MLGTATLPVVRVQKMSPSPTSKIISTGVRELEPLSTTASGWRRSATSCTELRHVARQRLTGPEPLVAVAQDLHDLIGRQLLLQVAGREIGEAHPVLDLLVVLLEADEAHLDAARRRRFRLELADHREHVGVDVVGVARVDQDVTPARRRGERVPERGPVQEADLVGQLDVEHLAADVLLEGAVQRAAQVAPQDEDDAERQADQDADQEVGQQDGGDGDDERQELLEALVPHLPEELRAGELEARRDEHGRQADSGMRFSHVGSSATQSSSSKPWTMVASLVLPPALMFTELRTITEVTGKPPISPATMLPTPWAISSRFGGRRPALRVELVDGLEVQERFERGDQAMVTAAM